MFDETVVKQKLDPTYALGVILKTKPLRDLARRGIPLAAYTRKLPDDLVKQISDFRKANIPRVKALRSDTPNMDGETKRLDAANLLAKTVSPDQADNTYIAQLLQEAHDNNQAQADANNAVAVAAAKLKKATADRRAADAALSAAKAQEKRKKLATTDLSDAAQAKLTQAKTDEDTAQHELDDAVEARAQRENQGWAGGFVLGSGDDAWIGEKYKARLAAATTMHDKRIAECYAPNHAIPHREGAPSSINTWDGTFTYGSGWNMTGGDGAHIPNKLASPKGAENFRIGARIIVDYFEKCAMWFDGAMQLRLHDERTVGEPKMWIVYEDDDGKSGYIVTSQQVAQVGSKMGTAIKYLSRNRRLMEAWSNAGIGTTLPDQPTSPSADVCMPPRDVMYELQYQLFQDLRMAHFNRLWNVCFTQASFFFLTHMNHFGGAYEQESVIADGITNGVVPTEPSNDKDPLLVEVSPGTSVRRSFANDVKLVRAGLTFMAHMSKYGTKTLGAGWAAYKLLWANFVEDVNRGDPTFGEAPYSPAPPAAAGAAGQPVVPPTWASAADVALPPATADEPVPLKPWLLTVEDVLPTLPDDATKAAWKKELLATWYVVNGDASPAGWQKVTYLIRKRPPEAPKAEKKAANAKTKK